MYECETCSATFWHQDDCEDHMEYEDHWPECETCPRIFRTQRACKQHMNDTGHWAPTFDCETCTREFRTQRACDQHMDALNHWKPRVPCESCSLKFHSESAADRHMRATGHYKNYCIDCDRRFQNENNLRMHLHSKVHRGNGIPCPFCKINYTTASGVTHHLETGSCTSAPFLNREAILRIIRERDPHGVIANKQLEWHKEETVDYLTTDRAYNGFAWECYICHRQFNAKHSLNSHANSPVHKQSVYHCPNSRGGCHKQFSTVAALFNHLESESCAFMRFEKVQQQLNGVLQGQRLISF